MLNYKASRDQCSLEADPFSFSQSTTIFWPSCDTGRKSYNFRTIHHATRKTQAQTATATNTVSTAPIIAASLVCFFRHGTASRRRLFSKLGLAPEAAEWIHRDVWPRLKELVQSWQVVNFEGHEEANRTSKDATFDNLARAEAQILKLEIELYEAQLGKSALRL
jgi:hypothetical protein